MGSIAAEVSLHCIICFEEFDVRDRPPVVLPCGHTYVCVVCAKRLRTCMECREPLFWTPAQSQHKLSPHVFANPAVINTRSPAALRYARGRYTTGPQTPPHPSMAVVPVKEEPQPLPLPKNTVLMAMIEAAERQRRILQDAKDQAVSAGREDEGTDDDSDDEDDSGMNKLDPIFAGVNAFVGTCGTYAVREPLGLAVLPFDPNKQHHQDDSSPLITKETNQEEKKAEETREPFTIEEGQKVQVVSVEEGVYRLARGAGYIVASVNQLVKVAGPLEKSCQYEGMLQSVLKKQEELQQQLDEINVLVHGLKDRILVEQDQPAEYPVITAPKATEDSRHSNDENDASSGLTSSPTTPTQQCDASPIPLQLTESSSSTEVQLGNPRTPAQRTPPADQYLHSPAHSCPMPGTTSSLLEHGLPHPFMDGEPAGLPRYRVNTDDDLHGLQWSFGCGSALFGERLIEQDCDTRNIMTLSFDDASLVEGGQTHRNSSAHSIGARTTASAHHLSPGEPSLRSGSFDGPINFRTGMSGHTGLSLTRKKSSPLSRPHIRMMSEHRGIAATSRTNTIAQQRRTTGMMHNID